eukprot:Gb_21041 [translate_table: standard]
MDVTTTLEICTSSHSESRCGLNWICYDVMIVMSSQGLCPAQQLCPGYWVIIHESLVAHSIIVETMDEATKLLGYPLDTVFSVHIDNEDGMPLRGSSLSLPFPGPCALQSALARYPNLLNSPIKVALLTLAAHAFDLAKVGRLKLLSSPSRKEISTLKESREEAAKEVEASNQGELSVEESQMWEVSMKVILTDVVKPLKQCTSAPGTGDTREAQYKGFSFLVLDGCYGIIGTMCWFLSHISTCFMELISQSKHENVFMEIARSMQLSRNICVALFSLQSWISFICHWLRAKIIVLKDEGVSDMHDENPIKAANNIFRDISKLAEELAPCVVENLALALGALCMVLLSSASIVTPFISKFLLDWMHQDGHEYKQWSTDHAIERPRCKDNSCSQGILPILYHISSQTTPYCP